MFNSDENCTFTDNVAYNGCDIGYSQLSLSKGYYVYEVNSNVSMNNNFFMHHSLENHKINSIIFIDVNSTHNPINTFTNNKVILYTSAVLFDGKIVENKNPNPYIIVHFVPRFTFFNNCMVPFNSKLSEMISFEFAFVSACDGYETQTPSFTPTTQISNKNIDNTGIETNILNKIYTLIIVIITFQMIVLVIILFALFLLLRRRNERNDIDPLIA